MSFDTFGSEQQKKYYEAELQKKVLYVPNLSMFLQQLNLQILKLPHEAMQQGFNDPIGTKYEDIVVSFCNGVEVAYCVLKPIRTQLEKECKLGVSKNLAEALLKLEWIYQLLEDADMLNDHVKTMYLPDVENDYDDELLDEVDLEDEPNSKTMPTPEPKTNDKELGQVEGQNKRPSFETYMEKGV